jgi:prepilin-type N-terminal cleavage/methylation domain-containing protein
MNKRGFTLIELLVVIAIIGILSSVVLASLNSARQKSRDSRRVADVKQIQNALELYYDASSTYPAALSSLAPTYISAVPTDPQTQSAYSYASLTSASAACTPSGSTKCPSYVLMAGLEDSGNPALNNDIDTDAGGISCDAATEYCVRP